MDETTTLLKELTEAHGVPGYEAPVRQLIVQKFAQYGSVTTDHLGSLICRVEGSKDRPRIMLASHMDEIGFMVRHISPEGFLRFVPLGGWFDQVLLGQRVLVQTRLGEVVGVIGVKPPHMLTADERKKVVEKKEMYIDIGATSKSEVEAAGVRVGDPVVPRADFVMMANGKSMLSKAFDNRVGVALSISVMQALREREHPNTIYSVATVQEEIGSRGATTSVELVKPDLALVLEADIAGDVPGIKAEESSVKLGGGPSMLLFDARMIPNLGLRDIVNDTAASLGIPLQYSLLEGGATDGAPIHLYKSGVPTLVIAVPARHVHTHGSILHRDDYDMAVRLVTELVVRLDEPAVSGLLV